MSKTAVIYWSGTGNTEQMAQAVLEGAKAVSYTHLATESTTPPRFPRRMCRSR